MVQLTGTNGAVTKSYDYDAFGVERSPVSSDVNPWRYCGEYFDAETGAVYLRARYYSPGTGRFSAEDPIRDGLNWYVYAGNNPIRYIDPLGLAEYQVGGLTLAPQFSHDAGFAYDATAKATAGDYASWIKWGFMSTGSYFAPHLIDASRMYGHYRENSGTDMKIDYSRAYKEDSIIKAAIDNEVSLIQDFVSSTYAEGGQTSFEIIGGLHGRYVQF